MNKVIPILSIIVAAAVLFISAAGLITVSIAVEAPPVAIIAIPVAVAGLAGALLSAGFTVMFFKSVLCRIAFFINLGSLAMSVASMIVWGVAL